MVARHCHVPSVRCVVVGSSGRQADRSVLARLQNNTAALLPPPALLTGLSSPSCLLSGHCSISQLSNAITIRIISKLPILTFILSEVLDRGVL